MWQGLSGKVVQTSSSAWLLLLPLRAHKNTPVSLCWRYGASGQHALSHINLAWHAACLPHNVRYREALSVVRLARSTYTHLERLAYRSSIQHIQYKLYINNSTTYISKTIHTQHIHMFLIAATSFARNVAQGMYFRCCWVFCTGTFPPRVMCGRSTTWPDWVVLVVWVVFGGSVGERVMWSAVELSTSSSCSM